MRADRDVVAEAYEDGQLLGRLAVLIRLSVVRETTDKRSAKGCELYEAILKPGAVDRIRSFMLDEGFSSSCRDTRFRLGHVRVELSTNSICIGIEDSRK